MLCDRPADVGGYQETGGAGKPFLSAGRVAEQLGLTPVGGKRTVKRDKKDTALSRHLRWLRKMQSAAREKRELEAAEAEAKATTKVRLAEESAAVREAVLERTADPSASSASEAPEPAPAAEKRPPPPPPTPPLPPPAPPAVKDDGCAEDDDMFAFVDSVVKEATGAKAATSAPEPREEPEGGLEPAPAAEPEDAAVRRAAKKKGSKAAPAWALTEREAEERDELEVEDLVNFAAGLDFDAYMQDMDAAEIARVIETMDDVERRSECADNGTMPSRPSSGWKRNFVRAMNHLTNVDLVGRGVDDGSEPPGAPSNYDGKTEASAARAAARKAKRASAASAADDENKWESSTALGDDPAERSKRLEATAAAKEFLRENPELKAVHSVSSVKAMLEKTGAGPVLAVIEEDS